MRGRALPLLLALGACLDAPPSSTGDGDQPDDDGGVPGQLVPCEGPEDCPDTGRERVCHCGSCAVPDPDCAPSPLRWVRGDGKDGECAPAPEAVALGYQSSCLLWSDGRVSCWGDDCSGQVGDGGAIDCADSPEFSAVPSLVRESTGGPPFEGAQALSLGSHHACALKVDGSVWCWGSNDLGKLGDGSAETNASTPVQVVTDPRAPLSGIVAIAAGKEHTCALDGEGFVHCWGDNSFLQLGVDGVSERNVAILSSSGSDFERIAAGGWHNCAARPGAGDDEMFCWGRGSFGQLGDNVAHEPGYQVGLQVVYESDPGMELVPTVFGLGENFSCSATAGPEVWCWGSNAGHALADEILPTNQDGQGALSARMTRLTLGSPPADLAGGTSFGCIRLEDGSVQCWGENDVGQVGIGGATSTPQGPMAVAIESAAIDAGDDHACAITAERTVVCWGGNAEGQLGNGDTVASPTPGEVIGLCQ